MVEKLNLLKGDVDSMKLNIIAAGQIQPGFTS